VVGLEGFEEGQDTRTSDSNHLPLMFNDGNPRPTLEHPTQVNVNNDQGVARQPPTESHLDERPALSQSDGVSS
jgi:hypothetical protein